MTADGESQHREPTVPMGPLVPFAAYTAQLAVGFALVALIVVPERVLLWSLRASDDRIGAGVLALQLVLLPVVAALVAVVAGRVRDRKRQVIYEGLYEVEADDPDIEVIDDPLAVRRKARRVALWVLVIWVVLGLAVPFMASSITALAVYAAIGARIERAAADRDGRELLCKPRWFVWLPLAWRETP